MPFEQLLWRSSQYLIEMTECDGKQEAIWVFSELCALNSMLLLFLYYNKIGLVNRFL